MRNVTHEKRLLKMNDSQATLVKSKRATSYTGLECLSQSCYSYRVCTFLGYSCINAILITYVLFIYSITKVDLSFSYNRQSHIPCITALLTQAPHYNLITTSIIFGHWVNSGTRVKWYGRISGC